MRALAHSSTSCFVYVVLCILTVQAFYQQPVLAKILWILSIVSILQLAWAVGRSKALRALGWFRWIVSLPVATLVTFILFWFIVQAIGIALLGWEH